MARRGFPEAADRIVELWRSGRREEAVRAVPDDYLDTGALIGDEARIRRRWEEGVAPPGVTGLIVGTDQLEALDLVAELAGTRDTATAEVAR
jgi:hypothetical protein